ncbi:hypothetical protein D3C72_2003340 [compost metagenome]
MPSASHGAFHGSLKIAMPHLHCGNVDSDARRIQPLCKPFVMVQDGLLHDPSAHVDDHARFLQHRNENGRRYQACLRVIPSNERLHAHEPPIG